MTRLLTVNCVNYVKKLSYEWWR